MQDSNALEYFYVNNLKEPLQRLEAARKVAFMKILVLAGILVSVNILLLFQLKGDLKALVVFTGLFSLIGFTIFAVSTTIKWATAFKSTIIPKFLARIEPSLTYDAEGKIASDVFHESRLYEVSQAYDYDGEDLVRGNLGGWPVSFCELNITRSTGKNSKKSRRVFRGIFLVAEVESGIDDSVWLMPSGYANAKEQLQNSVIGGMLGGLIDLLPEQAGEKVILDDSEFMSLYTILAETEETARRLLTDDLRRHLIALRKSTGQQVRVSFQPGQISVALSLDNDLFDPSVRKTVHSYEVVSQFVEDFRQAYGIIEAVRPAIQQ